MQVIKYEVQENDILVEFKRRNYAVSGMISKARVAGLPKKDIIQKVYEVCKPSLDYEEDRFLKGLPNSKTTDENGEVFVPLLPKVTKVNLSVHDNVVLFNKEQSNYVVNLSCNIKDQYGVDIVRAPIYSTTFGVVDKDTIIIPKVDEQMTITITANVEGVTDVKVIQVYPYIEPIPEQPTEMEIRISDLEMAIAMMLGGGM